jgi:Protein of unknown function (DUF2958)
MKLLTEEIKATIPKLYSQDEIKDPIVHVKFFTPWSDWTWYATEGEPSEDGTDFTFFGMVEGHEKELGYFVLSELESVKGPFGLKIERDLYFTPKPLSKATSKFEPEEAA